MKQEIPKIIHHIWSEIYRPLPRFCSVLIETWKGKHPEWKHVLWSEDMMNKLMKEEYPKFYSQYKSFEFDIQRWDIIRFFILKKYGGLYIDTDYECLENIEPLIENAKMAIALEPISHPPPPGSSRVLSNALMGSIPNHPFLDKVIDRSFSFCNSKSTISNKFIHVLSTTGPFMLSQFYEELSSEEKEDINLLEAKYIMPFDLKQIKLVISGIETEELRACLNEAYAVHYYSNSWV